MFTLKLYKTDKKLSYRGKTARCAMLINSCYVSRGMRAVKVSISKYDLQGHSRALALVPFVRSHTISHYLSIATICLYLAPFPIYIITHLGYLSKFKKVT